MRLNGWQRLWVVFSTPWVIVWFVVAILAGEDVGAGWSEMYRWSAEYVGIIFLPPIAAYIFGRGIAWAIRGFQK